MKKITQQESLAIDYAKAIGIFFVVLGHYDASVMNLFKPYTFHMPLFFLIGGITLNYKKEFSKYIKRSTKSVISYAAITYLITGIISEFLATRYSIPALGNAFISNPITTIKTAFTYNFANNRLFVVAWFLLAYYIASLLCMLICKFIYNRGIEGAAAIIFCLGVLIGFYAINVCSIGKTGQLTNIITQSMVALMFFMIGNSLREYLHVFTSPFLALACCVVIYLLRGFGMTSDFIMSLSSYPYGAVVTIAQSLCGIYMVMFLASSLSGNHYNWIKFIGKRTKSIMSYHIFSFILLDLLFYKAGMYDIRKTDAFIHFKSWYTMPLYVSFSILVPALGNYLYEQIKNFVKSRSKSYQMNT